MEIVRFVLGPVETNTYLIADPESGQAAVIDPAWDGERIADEAARRGWRIGHIWLTHAHFDHLGGAAGVADRVTPPPLVALHPQDGWLWRVEGGARWFGMRLDPGPEPTVDLRHGMQLHLGRLTLEVRHAPGHTPGHVMFYCPQAQVLFAGDVIFYEGIGRTDLPGGDHATLLESIRSQVFTLPPETRILPGHGPETTVGHERAHNPFVRG